ncbi:ATP dependent DNA ligase [Nocardia gamkensis]|uniref:ATP dependent DNA ligase n=1 Tax=Nocardia gamkensis TaxID=352869 RepID=UPI0007A506FE
MLSGRFLNTGPKPPESSDQLRLSGDSPFERTSRIRHNQPDLCAYDESDRLVYVGHVGTGFTMAARRALLEQSKALATPDSPFERSAPSWPMTAARWVRPQLVGTVEYREFVGALRHPSWRGLRAEIDPTEVRLPTRDVNSPGRKAVMAGLAVPRRACRRTR